jgi:hypothetical protein
MGSRMSATGQSSSEVTRFVFGALALGVVGQGLYLGGEKLNEKVAALTPHEVRAANKAAWELRRASERSMDRFSNVTVHGHTNYDSASFNYFVAKAVCAATWQRMRAAS